MGGCYRKDLKVRKVRQGLLTKVVVLTGEKGRKKINELILCLSRQ